MMSWAVCMMLSGVAVSSEISTEPVHWNTDGCGNGNWYQFILVDQSWATHDDLACGQGAHLVTIQSQAENDFLEALRDSTIPDQGSNGGAFLTGGFLCSGEWLWVTDEPFDYTNWGISEGIEQPENDSSQNRLGLRWQDDGTWCDEPESIEWFAVIEWSADCNGDGIVDYGQILDGSLSDADSNGVPDICECSADLDSDLVVSIHDLLIVLAEYGTTNPIGDANLDGIVDVNDILAVIASWGSCL